MYYKTQTIHKYYILGPDFLKDCTRCYRTLIVPQTGVLQFQSVCVQQVRHESFFKKRKCH